jgi:hypothetical protein
LHSKKKYRLWEDSRYGNSEHFPDVFEAMNMCHDALIKPIGHDEHRSHDPYTRFRKYTRRYTEGDSMVVYFGIWSHLPRSIFETTSVNIPIMDMSWEEDAYRVKALSHKATEEFSYDHIKSKWCYVSLPRIDHQYIRYKDDLPPSDAPPWMADREWRLLVSEMFDRELDDGESEHSDW